MKTVFVGAGCVATWLAEILPETRDRVALDPGPVADGFPMPVLPVDVLNPGDAAAAAITGADLLVLAVPVDVALAVLDRWGAHLKTGCAVIDTLSTKSLFAERLAERLPGLGAAGVNPLFRPQRGLPGGRVLATVYRPDARIAQAFDHIRDYGCDVDDMSFDQHDRIMGAVQGLTHITALAFGQALQAMGPPPDTATTPPYRCTAAIFARLVSGAPHIPWEIQRNNPYANAARRQLIDTLEHLDAQILENDQAGFARDIVALRTDPRLRVDKGADTAARLFIASKAPEPVTS
ncbi:prephenate dehydrogenase/arogenate dehydrogenase family protein [Thalassococcus sp. BH17M4-6]|uniref:prephenate dehydrogenase/arogenate dehydrogenase family protein n=1 Tax=Thalassococcus sp. BH17M4-6 TaxID=3413148 RepID=UPI003BE0A867